MEYGVYKHEAESFSERLVEAVSWGVAADGFVLDSEESGFVVEGTNLAEQPITITSNHMYFEVRPGSTGEVTLKMKPPRAEHGVSSTCTCNWVKFFGMYVSDNFKLVGLADSTLWVNGYKWDSVQEDFVFTSELFFEGDE